MAFARVVQVAVDEIVHVVAVRDGFVSAAVAVDVARFVSVAGVVGRADGGMGVAHLDAVLVDVVFMRKMQMAVVEVIHVIAVLDRGVTAAWAVDVVRMMVDRVLGHVVVGGLGSTKVKCRSQARERGPRRFE